MTKSNVTPFVFEGEEEVRIIDRDGQPWFVAADVCRVLELSNTSKALGSLHPDEKGITIGYTLGGDQEFLTVSESGLYALIFRSRKPQAQRLRKWVTSEVLPAIRKTGRYEKPGAAERRGARPWNERSLEEKNTSYRGADCYRKNFNPACAAWFMTEVEGMPIPPKQLQPMWCQQALNLQAGALSVTISSISGGA